MVINTVFQMRARQARKNAFHSMLIRVYKLVSSSEKAKIGMEKRETYCHLTTNVNFRAIWQTGLVLTCNSFCREDTGRRT